MASPDLLASITGGGIDLPALALALVALLGSAAVTLRSVRRRSPRRRQELAAPVTPPGGRRHVALFMAALAVAAAAVVVAWDGAKRSDARTSILQLWLLPDPTAGPGAVRIGVDSANTPVVTYRLVLRSGARPIRTWVELPLRTGHFRATVPVRAPGRVDAFLYRAGARIPLRHVRLWLKAAAQA